jgi:hypothetical protein
LYRHRPSDGAGLNSARVPGFAMSRLSNRRIAAGSFLFAVGMASIVLALVALAHAPWGLKSPGSRLLGASVYAAEGTEIGAVSKVTIDQDGQISELNVTTLLPNDLGVRSLAIVRGGFVVAGNVVVLDFTSEEIGSLAMKRQKRPAGIEI